MASNEVIVANKDLPSELLIIPMSGKPLFPGIFTPILINEADDVALVEKAYEGDRTIGLVLTREETQKPKQRTPLSEISLQKKDENNEYEELSEGLEDVPEPAGQETDSNSKAHTHKDTDPEQKGENAQEVEYQESRNFTISEPWRASAARSICPTATSTSLSPRSSVSALNR